MQYSDIIGQARTKQLLAQLARNERVPHALLFLGSAGNGSLPLALAFAQALQCEGTANEDGGCGGCNACRKTSVWAHPDVHFSFPTVGANAVSTDFLKPWRAALNETPYMDVNLWLQRLEADNKQGNITTAECNAIIKKLSLKIFEGRYKILLMWLPEYLGKEGNRLLKLIEEPPEKTIFLLVAENADMILNTILSRCQIIKTDMLSDEEIAEGLEQKQGLEAGRAAQIAFLAGGDFGAAQLQAGNPDNDNARLLLDWLRKCWRGNGVEMVQWTEKFAQLGRENQKQFLQYGLHFLREMLQLIVAENTRLRLQPEEMTTAVNMSKILNFEKIGALTELFNDNIYYVERNANPKILFLNASVEINKILKK
jgi:DNA polymerase-3 subunit delta'